VEGWGDLQGCQSIQFSAYVSLEGAVRHHLDPQTALANYDVSQLPPALQGSCQTDPHVHEALLATLDPLLSSPTELSEDEIADILNFLYALTDPAARNLDDDIPLQVPSGLPVDGNNLGISDTTIN
jgi:cytochrome c peroxidase